jgi:hypothetical protein
MSTNLRYKKGGFEMVSQKFVAFLHQLISREFKGMLAQAPDVRVLGSAEDQYAGMAASLKTSLVPFTSTSYQASEFIYVRLNLADDVVPSMDFAAPVLNVKETSVQGVATFVAAVPAPAAETYVERMVGWKYQLLPYNLLKAGNKPKAIVKQGMIRSNAVNQINGNKKLCNKLRAPNSSNVEKPFPGRGHYSIKFDVDNYPGGMFCVVPFKGNSILVSREAGTHKSKVDNPSWALKERFLAFKGVASALKQYPDRASLLDGQFFVDTTLQIALVPILAGLEERPI